MGNIVPAVIDRSYQVGDAREIVQVIMVSSSHRHLSKQGEHGFIRNHHWKDDLGLIMQAEHYYQSIFSAFECSAQHLRPEGKYQCQARDWVSRGKADQ